MQAFKLVNGGFVDKVIVFDTLPEDLVKNVKTRTTDGFPRSWAKWLSEIGSTRTVFKTDTSVDLARNWTFKKTPIGVEPCFFVLDYADINADKEAWRLICDFVKVNAGPEVRLKERIEDMALALAANPTQALQVEYEDIPVIKVSSNGIAKVPDVVQQGEVVLVEEVAPKRRGRPKKVAVEA